jgi:predicted membrane-bound spermidine synthase
MRNILKKQKKSHTKRNIAAFLVSLGIGAWVVRIITRP